MSSVNPHSAEFLYELYATALCQEQLCAVLSATCARNTFRTAHSNGCRRLLPHISEPTRHRRHMPYWHRLSMRITIH